MKTLREFLIDGIEQKTQKLINSTPIIRNFQGDVVSFLNSMWRKRTWRGKGGYYSCVRALRALCPNNNYDQKAEKTFVASNLRVLRDWHDGKTRANWFGPNVIPGICIEQAGNLVLMYQNTADRLPKASEVIFAGYIDLQKRLGVTAKAIICFVPERSRGQEVVGRAGCYYALVSAAKGWFLQANNALHEAAHQLLRQTAYGEIEENYFSALETKLKKRNADDLRNEVKELEEGFVTAEVNSVIGIDSHWDCIYQDLNEPSSFSLQEIKSFFKKKTENFSGCPYSILGSLFAFLYEETGQKPLDCLTALFTILLEEIYPHQAIEKLLSEKWERILDVWAARVFFSIASNAEVF